MTTMTDIPKINNFDQLLPRVIKEINQLKLNHNLSQEYYQICFNIPKIDLLTWAQNQTDSTKFFWSSRDRDLKISAIGSCDCLKSDTGFSDSDLFKNIEKILNENASCRLRWIGGGRFSSNHPADSIWEKFGNVRFYLPRFELAYENNQYRFVLNIKNDELKNTDQLIAACSQLNFNDKLTPYNNHIANRKDKPDKDGWIKNINSSLEDIKHDKYKKIVMARRSDLTMNQPVEPLGLLNELMTHSTNCFYFSFQLDKQTAFIGASPEKLFVRNHRELECEALAGTRKRSLDPDKDKLLAKELLENEKEIYEQQLVSQSITEGLAPFILDNYSDAQREINLLQLTRVQHLISRFKFKLKENVSTYDLVLALHPTAAVGGYPRQAVIEAIYNLEQFDRGWYASPVGWMTKDKAEFAVAIRSGLIQNDRLRLYSGAGIVSGSQPESEWKEIENKISNFIKILK